MSLGSGLPARGAMFRMAQESQVPIYPVILPLCPGNPPDARERLQAQRRRAREALVKSCTESGLPAGPFEKDERNVPLPFGGIYWSISHKPRYVAGVVSSSPIGIDLEEIAAREPGLFGYLAGEPEWDLAENREWETFFRYWTAKEAVLKATGRGLSDLKNARIERVLDTERLIVRCADRLWPVQHYRFPNHIVSVAHDGEIHWMMMEESSAGAPPQ
jgi:4'-phosphopantetheinyl transferase